MKKQVVCTLVGWMVFGASVGYAQDLTTIEGRSQWINQLLIGHRYRESRLPEINLFPDSLAVQQKIRDVVCTLDNQAVPIGVYALGLHGDHFPDSLKTDMKECIKSWREVDGHGTENHALMQNSAGYLFAQWFPGESGWLTNQGALVTSEELRASLKDKMMAVFSSLYEKGYAENLSTTYDMLHIFPILAIYEFADDQELVNAAEAALLYHFSYLAINSFHGMTISPFNRSNNVQSNTPQMGTQGNIQFTRWYYWPESSNYYADADYWLSHPHNWTVMYCASVDWQPPKIIGRLANGEGVPYSARGMSAGFGYWGEGWYPENLRTVYRTADYAIGTGHFNYKPTEFYVDYKNFAILYKSSDTFNYLECSHNYWYSDASEADAWKKSANSPFQETAQHENTVISLFNIPATDPWQGAGNASWQENRDGHFQNLIQRADIKYPKTIDELVESEGWIFLREGETFIGIKPLRPYTIDTQTEGTLGGFNMIRSPGATNAVIFEVGTSQEHADFDTFQNTLKTNTIEVDWDSLIVAYTYTKNETLKAEWVAPDYSKKTADDRVLVRPKIYMNGDEILEFTQLLWPVMESPYCTLDNRILTLEQGGETLLVDWSGPLPIISYDASPDCNGDLNGSAFMDDCGVCAGGKTGLQPNTCLPEIEEVDGNNFIVHPNPTEDTIYIEYNPTRYTRVGFEMFDMSGKNIPIAFSNEEYGQYAISTANIPDGFYLLQISDMDKTVYKRKVVVKH